MRLNKYIAQAGVASRRKADELTLHGNVKINGLVMKEPGYDVKDGDVVEVNGQIVKVNNKLVYYALNKPKGYITSADDEKGRPTVFELMTDVEERLFPVGRLDYNTSGLLLMTNDGDLAYKLTHPKHEIYKTYHVKVAGIISQERVYKLRNGVDIGGFVTSKARVTVLKQSGRTTLLEVQIKEGKNRQIRKMFDAVGNKVLELQRVAIGELKLYHLKEGHYRKLTRQEIDYLKSC